MIFVLDTVLTGDILWIDMNPFWKFGLVALLATFALAIPLAFRLPALGAWLIAANLVSLALFRYDKMVAGSSRTRVPELVLLLTVVMGGTVGAAIGMWLIRPRHKTRSSGFIGSFLLILAAQAGVLLLVASRT